MTLDRPVEGIFFDLGWTLLKPASGDWLLCDLFYEIAGRDVFERIPGHAVREALRRGLAILDEDHLLYTEEKEYGQFIYFFELLSRLVPALGLTRAQIEALAYDKVYNDGNYVIFDDAGPTLERLRGRCRLGVISDTWPSLGRVLKNAGLLGYFDTVTFSCHHGVCKPDGKLYRHALAEMALPPGRCVFVDDFERNLEGAARFGIQPVLITARPDAAPSGRFLGIGRISELLEYV